MANLLSKLADIADEQFGLHEEPRGSNRGKQIQKFFDADNYDPTPGPKDEGYPWCASFVSWVVQEFLRSPEGQLFSGIVPPVTPSAFELIDWAERQNGRCTVFSPAACQVGGLWPYRGDIVVFTFSHCGVVLSSSAKERNFLSIEGNTDSKGSREGWEVARKGRVFSSAKRFIRLLPGKAIR